MANKDYLLEIGLEEMPARFVTDAMLQLESRTAAWLKDKRITYTAIASFSTPRRLAVRIEGAAEAQEDMVETKKGPARSIAQAEDGTWTKAAIGFARGQGLSENDLYIESIKDVEYVFAKKEEKGRKTAELLPELGAEASKMTFPKSMKWGSHTMRYVRPVQWIVSLYGTEIIPMEMAGVQAGRETRGHRFLGANTVIESPAAYEAVLEKEWVIAEPSERKEMIRKQIAAIEERENWLIPINEDLLEEINNLVEYPTALSGAFDVSYLELPQEVLITSMREHQRYFPVEDENARLLPNFVTVRNGNEEHIENVRKGNEKVLRARLADGRFFYEEDQKLPPEQAAAKLDNIVYQEGLGTIGDKVRRIQGLSLAAAKKISLSEEAQENIRRGAFLSKFDLVTLMVDEFTELQGIVGEKYALLAGENETVARSIREHYLPRFAGDMTPSSKEAAVIGLADKMDTVVTAFGIGAVPTGSQDPNGIRRHAAGAVAIMLAQELPITVEGMIQQTMEMAAKAGVLKRPEEELAIELQEFFKQRIRNLLLERSISHDVCDALLQGDIGYIYILVNKAGFLQAQKNKASFKETVEALSRVTNISKKAALDAAPVRTELMENDQEKQLMKAHEELAASLPSLLQDNSMEEALQELEKLSPYINDYFEHVMVMSDDEAVKQNRLAQMVQLSGLIQTFADFRYLVFTESSD